MSDLIEIMQILVSASTFNMLKYIILVEIDEESTISHRYAIDKGRGILMAFLCNCGYSTLILPQNSTSGCLRLVAMWNPKPHH